ncbi:TonB family protein [Corallococcus carmarthensis]|uniref:TonB family protein n=1 Tax=Corallococcus carmarthensis TaxID=2316728 RepID=A0A3A8KGY6_9BACT|nr:TonB family protein [Corallococcus carmarthensis]NOK17611.1 TonB family protein [Corallococcus carmarthensis]RKH06796.1 TonB family protein [Corallococcus carmarthensis]
MLRIPKTAVVVLALALASGALAASGSPQLQTYFQGSVDSPAYQQQAFQRVAKVWKQPGPKGTPALGQKTIVQAVLGKDGKLISTAILTESGSKAWDAAALAAVKKAAPFPPLPKNATAPTLEAHFHFAWVSSP